MDELEYPTIALPDTGIDECLVKMGLKILLTKLNDQTDWRDGEKTPT